MTNEELVIEIQKGHTEFLPELWDNVHRFVKKKANRFLRFLGENPPCEFYDLYNSGYIELLYAIKLFKPEAGFSFLTYYGYALRNAFNEAAGLRTRKSRNDPLKSAISLSAPIQEGEEGTIEDTIADDTDIAEDVAKRIYNEELHNALENALSKIKPDEEKAIRMKYYEGLNLDQIGDKLGVTAQRAGQLCKNGLRSLRNPEIMKELEQFIDSRSNFYLGVSTHNQQPSVELLVIERKNIYNKASRFNGMLL